MKLRRALRLRDREIVAFVGGGGKTTAMFRLANELAAEGRHVITTTTTRIFAAQTRLAPAHIVAPSEAGAARSVGALPWPLSDLQAALDAHGHALVTGPVDDGIGKAFGVEPALIPQLASLPGVSAVLIEADGSRMRPLKAPADHEPVIPAAATLVVAVVGADALGQPLDAVHVHRPDLLRQIVSIPPDSLITPEIITTAVVHPNGGRKSVPGGARFVLLVNKIEQEERLAGAREIARLALQNPAVDSVVLGAAASDDPAREVWERVAAIVLAGGEARRMGQPKQLLEWRGKSLIAHAVDTALASQADSVIVVVGAEGERVARAVADRPARIVFNNEWEAGQSASVRAGLDALPENIGAGIFMLADQPRVPPALVEALIRRHRETLAPIVSPRAGGRRANPALFDRATWADLRQVTGDAGGRGLFEKYADQVAWVDWSEEILEDVDTPEDFAALVEGG